MYLQSLVVGAARVDLDGNAWGEANAADQEHAAAKLAKIQAAREAKRTAVAAGAQAAKQGSSCGAGVGGKGLHAEG